MSVSVFVFLYLCLQLLIGYLVSRRIRSETDYFLAGRQLGPFAVTFSLFATWFGAETCIGASGAVYEKGLAGGRIDPFAYSLCLVLMGIFLATRYWRGGHMTLASLFRERYGLGVEQLSVWIMLPSSLIWAAAQVRAFGQVLSSISPLSVNAAILVATVFVVLYTFWGGLLGDVITDVVQGAILIFGLGGLLWFVYMAHPNLPDLLATVDPARLRFIQPGESFWVSMDAWVVPVLGSLVSQELFSRVVAARSGEVARRASFFAFAIYFFLGSVPVLLGLLGPNLLPGLADFESFLPQLAHKYLPPVLFVIFAGALISAVLSTIDSTLLGVSALISHNFIVPRFNIKSERVKTSIGRGVVMGAGVVSYFMAIHAKGVYHLIETVPAFGAAGVLVVTVFGLYSKFGDSRSAIMALWTGVIVSVVGEYGFHWKAPFLAAIASSVVAFLVPALPIVLSRSRWVRIDSYRS